MAYGAWYNTYMKLKNPFLTAGYAGADYFCDRVDETKKLIAAIDNFPLNMWAYTSTSTP